MMWPFTASKTAYAPVKDEADTEVLDEIYVLGAPPTPPDKYRVVHVVAVVFFSLLLGSGLIFIVVAVTHKLILPSETSSPSQTNANTRGLRREWRTLSQPEKDHYITSVQCLLSRPSIFAGHAAQNSSLYEDFPYIHSHAGYRTHNSASFLPWHRYFLHIYENTLRGACNFTGELVYWDWTLDSADLAHAPVFDPETGFGGDGDPDGEVTVGTTGRCVIDGPFANVEAKFYDVKYQPHCLSRGFIDDEGTLGHIDGTMVSPESIEKVMALNDYEQFVTKLESVVHDTIPFGVGGDFWTFTAPYDPLFYLHHTQLDRLWYIWQQRDPEKRFMAYNGHGQRHSVGMASLKDMLSMQGLAPDIKVEEVMRTEGDMLQYRY